MSVSNPSEIKSSNAIRYVMKELKTRGKINWRVSWSAPQRYMVWFSVVAVLIATFVYATVYQFPLLG